MLSQPALCAFTLYWSISRAGRLESFIAALLCTLMRLVGDALCPHGLEAISPCISVIASATQIFAESTFITTNLSGTVFVVLSIPEPHTRISCGKSRRLRFSGSNALAIFLNMPG